MLSQDIIFLFIFIIFFVAVLLSIFTKKGRALSTKGFFWGGEILKDYGWLDDAEAINHLIKQRIQVLKYKKDDEIFYVLMVRDTSFASVQMMPVKLSEQEAKKLITILSG